MTYRRNDEIQAGLIAYLKSKTAITSLLYIDDPEEIKEFMWQGTVANFPGVRLRIISNDSSDDCTKSRYSASILAFSELASSQEADQIAGIIAGILRRRGFSSEGVAFTSKVTSVIHAVRQDQRTWRSEVLINGIAS
jgi:hypothetical protein